MTDQRIELKGSNFTLSVIHLFDPEIEIISKSLKEKVAQAPSFFKFAPIVVNVSHIPEFNDWKKLKKTIADAQLFLVGISGCSTPDIKASVQQAGLAVLSEGKAIELNRLDTHKNTLTNDTTYQENTHQFTPVGLRLNNAKNPQTAKEQLSHNAHYTKTKIITTPIRSGQQIYAKNADLVIINNIGAGAEVIADGNIHIYGLIRGKAIAGASGDKGAQIFCQQLEAELISIAGNFWLSDEIPSEYIGKSSLIKLEETGLMIEKL